MKLSDSTQISLPARNLLAILAAVAVGTMSYFTIVERLNSIETNLQLMEKEGLYHKLYTLKSLQMVEDAEAKTP